MHATLLSGFIVDPSIGLIRLNTGGYDPVFGNWGPGSMGGLPGGGSFASGPNAIRAQYNAGFATIPTPIQQGCAELVHDLLNLDDLDQRLSGETIGEHQVNIAQSFAGYALPASVRGKIQRYIAYRV